MQLDVLTEPYTASYGIATRIRTDAHDVRSVTAQGLVRGVTTDLHPDDFVNVSFRQSNLTLRVQNTSAARATVHATLRDDQTGEPIATARRAGFLVIEGRQVNTTADGTVAVSVRTNGSGIAARYQPGQWWLDGPAYTGDSDVVYADGTAFHLLSVLYRAGIPISILLIGVFIIARTTGWDIWPPWGRR